MKKHFVTGLVLLLPTVLTIMIVVFVFNLFTQPFAGFVKSFMTYYNVFDGGVWVFSSDQLRLLTSQVIVLMALFFLLTLLGLLARGFFFHYVVRYSEYVLRLFPIISSIYNTSKDIINTLFRPSAKSFKQVVLINFPSDKYSCIGLISREIIPGLDIDKVAVFVPTTPNPTSGFLLIACKKDLVYLDMKVEEAFKCIISCGVVSPPFQKLPEQKTEIKLEPEIKLDSKLETGVVPS